MGHWGMCYPWSLRMHANFADPMPDGFHFWMTLSPRTSEPVRHAPVSSLQQNSGDATDRGQTTTTTSIRRHQTPPRYRHVIHRPRCTVQTPPSGVAPITAKRHRPFIKREVHNLAQRRRRRTEPRPQGNCTHIISCGLDPTRGQTDRHTDAQ